MIAKVKGARRGGSELGFSYDYCLFELRLVSSNTVLKSNSKELFLFKFKLFHACKFMKQRIYFISFPLCTTITWHYRLQAEFQKFKLLQIKTRNKQQSIYNVSNHYLLRYFSDLTIISIFMIWNTPKMIIHCKKLPLRFNVFRILGVISSVCNRMQARYICHLKAPFAQENVLSLHVIYQNIKKKQYQMIWRQIW